jgi:hypothetical protein
MSLQVLIADIEINLVSNLRHAFTQAPEENAPDVGIARFMGRWYVVIIP